MAAEMRERFPVFPIKFVDHGRICVKDRAHPVPMPMNLYLSNMRARGMVETGSIRLDKKGKAWQLIFTQTGPVG
jgi:hypothetical protein